MRAIMSLMLCLLASQINAATFTVTSTADTAGTTCAATCTLRQALGAANSAAGADTIAFNIAGAGPHRISLGSALQSTSTVHINGYSQPGAAPNTAPLASNAQLKIIIDARTVPVGSSALTLNSDSLVTGVSFLGSSSNPALDLNASHVQGCWFGVEPDGVTVVNHGMSVRIIASQPMQIGGVNPAERNVFVAASTAIFGATLGVHNVRGNLFGVLPDGATPAPVDVAVSGLANVAGQLLSDNTIACTGANAVQGFGATIELNRFGTTVSGGNPGCTIGRISASNGQRIVNNVFANYQTSAVTLTSNVSGVVFQNNRLSVMNGAAFDLNNNGFTPNDLDDSDTGANGLQNFPVLTQTLLLDANRVQLAGTLRSTPNTAFALDFLGSDEVNRAAFNFFPLAGGERLGTTSIQVTTDAAGMASFGPVDVSFDGSGTLGVISATATRLDAGGNRIETSEISEARATYAAGDADLVVSNTNSGGAGSLLRALLEAEARPDNGNRDRVVFNIPGAGPHTLSTGVLSDFLFSGRIELDGLSQPGSVANTSELGLNAQLKIDISGSRFGFSNSDTLVRGLVLRGPSALLSFNGGGAVEGSYIGVTIDGLALSSSVGNTAQINCVGCRIGGPNPAQRNLIGCPVSNSMSCVNVGGTAAVVEGNLIGVQSNGNVRLVVPTDPGAFQVFTGIDLQGNFAQIRGNTLGGFVQGIRLVVSNALIQGNRIGVGVDGTSAIGNARHGINVSVGARIIANQIANNVHAGIHVNNGVLFVSTVENKLWQNGGLGVDLNFGSALNGDGVSPNDPMDTDAGPNNGQNFPLLGELRRSQSGISGALRLNSTPNQSFRIRYCYVTTPDTSGHGECDQPIVGVFQTVTTDAGGDFSGNTPVLPFSALGHLTATAAVVNGSFESSSEFAQSTPILDNTGVNIDSVSASPSVFGQPITVSVRVNGILGVPTGNVTVQSGNGGSCTLVLSAGSGSCALTPGAAGATTLTAAYLGASAFAPSNATIAHTVNAAPTSTTILSDTPDPSTFGDAITVSFQVQSTPIAVGSVTISDGTAQCVGTIGAGGNGSCVLTPAGGGTISLSASYSGSSNFVASSDTEPHTVTPVASNLAILDSTPNPSVSGQAVAVSAQLSSGVGTPAGPIVISDGAGASCQIAGASGSCNLQPVNAGTITLRADFNATATHLASSATRAQVIDRALTSVVASPPSASAGGPPRQFAAMRFPVAINVTAPGAGVPSGTVTVTGTPGVEVCVITLPAAFCDLVVRSPGVRNFSVNYGGDSRFQTSSTDVSATVLADVLLFSGFEGE